MIIRSHVITAIEILRSCNKCFSIFLFRIHFRKLYKPTTKTIIYIKGRVHRLFYSQNENRYLVELRWKLGVVVVYWKCYFICEDPFTLELCVITNMAQTIHTWLKLISGISQRKSRVKNKHIGSVGYSTY